MKKPRRRPIRAEATARQPPPALDTLLIPSWVATLIQDGPAALPGLEAPGPRGLLRLAMMALVEAGLTDPEVRAVLQVPTHALSHVVRWCGPATVWQDLVTIRRDLLRVPGTVTPEGLLRLLDLDLLDPRETWPPPSE